MLTKLIRKTLKILPAPVRNSVYSYGNRIFKTSVIRKWEKNGRPVPPPHQVKQQAIEQYRTLSGNTIFVETGTYLGDMVEAQKRNFAEIYSIEVDDAIWQNAVKRFSNQKHIHILKGDSAKVLPEITKQLDSPALFWLDGHYSGGVTGKGDLDCPIYGEIDAIFGYKKLNHVMLIDDARCFDGTNDYPTIPALTSYVKAKDAKYNVEVKDDIIRIAVP